VTPLTHANISQLFFGHNWLTNYSAICIEFPVKQFYNQCCAGSPESFL